MKLERANLELESKLEVLKMRSGMQISSHNDKENNGSSKSISKPKIILLETQIMELRQEKNMLKSKVNILQ